MRGPMSRARCARPIRGASPQSGPLLGLLAPRQSSSRFTRPHRFARRIRCWCNRHSMRSAGSSLSAASMLSQFSERLRRAGLSLDRDHRGGDADRGSYGASAAEPLRSYARVAPDDRRRAPGARIICYPRYVQALPFYAAAA